MLANIPLFVPLLCRYESLRDPTSPMRESIRDQSRKTLRQALHLWLDQYPEDFKESPNFPCLGQLEAFCARVMPDSELDQKVSRPLNFKDLFLTYI